MMTHEYVLDYKLDEQGLRDLLEKYAAVEERISTKYVLVPSDYAEGKERVQPKPVYRYILLG